MNLAINSLKKALILVFLLYGFTSLAQTADFVVYFAAGKAGKIAGGKILPIKKGDNLHLSDKLDIEKNAQVILVCKNGNSIKLMDSGRQNLSDAIGQCSRQPDVFTYAYFRFIFDEFTQTNTKINEQNYLNNLGAISRGRPALNIFPDTINYYDGSIKIAWRDGTHTGKINLFDDPKALQPLKKINYTHNTLLLGTLTTGLKSPGVYFWNISNSIHKNSPVYLILKMDKIDYDKNVTSILKNVIKTTPAETAYMSAFLLEKNHFLVEAAKYYKQAYILEPENAIYKNTKLRLYE